MNPATLTCEAAEELAGALAFDALDLAEFEAVANHAATCSEPHSELRAALGAGMVLEAALEPVTPSPALRSRIMTSIAADAEAARAPSRPSWFRRPWLARVAAGLAAATLVVLLGWNLVLQGRLADRQAELERVAAALSTDGAVQRVTGTAGGGLIVSGPDGPLFVASVPPAGAGKLYEMWLLDAAGAAVPVGTFDAPDPDGLVIVELERPLTGFTTFAVTVEASRVDAPSSQPVLVGPLS
jgi:hypothetical protein